jgi:acyl-homoserine lactone acylase PvdQ
VGLGERLGGALGLGASPGPFAPHQPGRAPEAGHVDQQHVAAPATAGDDAAAWATHRRGSRLHHYLQHTVSFADLDDMEPVEPDEQITPLAVGGIGT